MRRGIQDTLVNVDNRVQAIDLSLLPTTEEAVERYGGCISEPCCFGIDPIASNMREIRENTFFQHFHLRLFFCEVSNSCKNSFALLNRHYLSAFSQFLSIIFFT